MRCSKVKIFAVLFIFSIFVVLGMFLLRAKDDGRSKRKPYESWISGKINLIAIPQSDVY